LTNRWGGIEWAKRGNFKASTRAVRLVEVGRVLEAEARDGRGWIANRLRTRIVNDGGNLEFGDEHG